MRWSLNILLDPNQFGDDPEKAAPAVRAAKAGQNILSATVLKIGRLEPTPFKPCFIYPLVPFALNVGDSGFLVVLGEFVSEGRHLPTHGGATLIDCAHQHIEWMVPGVARSVERGRRIGAILQGFSPIEGALSVAAMAACAVVVEYSCAALDLGLSVPATVYRLFAAAAD